MNDGTSGPDTSPVIGGAVGGAILLLIISALCIVVCWITWSHKKKLYKFSNRELAELGSDVIMATNSPYYNNNENRKEEAQYDYIKCDKILQRLPQDEEDTIKWDPNPSYGKVGETETTFYGSDNAGCNVTIQINPSYNSNSREISEDQDGYVKADQYHSQSREVANYLEITVPTTNDESLAVSTGDIDNVNTNPNPSYDSVPGGVKLEDNPSYNKIKFI